MNVHYLDVALTRKPASSADRGVDNNMKFCAGNPRVLSVHAEDKDCPPCTCHSGNISHHGDILRVSNLQSYFVHIISVFEPLFELEELLSLLVSAQNDKDYDKNHLMYACMR